MAKLLQYSDVEVRIDGRLIKNVDDQELAGQFARRVGKRLGQHLDAQVERQLAERVGHHDETTCTFSCEMVGDWSALDRLARELRQLQRAATAKATRLLRHIEATIDAKHRALVFGCASALEGQLLDTTAAARIVRLVEQGDVEIREMPDDYVEADRVYVLREERDPFGGMMLLEPPESKWPWRDFESDMLMSLYRAAAVPPQYILMALPHFGEPWRAPRRLSRREQHRADVRAGLAARRARMRRSS